MTLALYGKTRRRQGILVMLGLFAVFAALIGGVAVNDQKVARAQVTASVEGAPSVGSNCTNAANVSTSDEPRAVCTGTQYVEIPVTAPSIPATATDLSFQVSVEAKRGGSGSVSANVLLSSTTKSPTAVATTFTSTESVEWVPGDTEPT